MQMGSLASLSQMGYLCCIALLMLKADWSRIGFVEKFIAFFNRRRDLINDTRCAMKSYAFPVYSYVAKLQILAKP